MKNAARNFEFPTAALCALFSGVLTLLSLIAFAMILSFTADSDSQTGFSAMLAVHWPLMLFAALLLSAISAVLGYYMGASLGAPLRRAVSHLERIGALESGRRQATEALAELQSLAEACMSLSAGMATRQTAGDELLAAAAHALKAPLARQSLQLELLKRRVGATPELQILERETALMGQSIRATLDYARCGTAAPQFEELDAAALMQEAVERNRPLALEKRQQLILSLPQTALPVKADAARLGRVLDEMLFNAVKFTPEDGSIEAAAQLSEGRLTLSVCDSGPGLDDAEIQRIFEPYFRGEAARSNCIPGSGMGMALAARDCAAMQAVMQVQRNSNGGLCVSVEFPPSTPLQAA